MPTIARRRRVEIYGASVFLLSLLAERSERKIINIPWRAGALFLRVCQTGTYIYGRGREKKNSISALNPNARRASSPQ
jgi:hypothetical protein